LAHKTIEVMDNFHPYPGRLLERALRCESATGDSPAPAEWDDEYPDDQGIEGLLTRIHGARPHPDDLSIRSLFRRCGIPSAGAALTHLPPGAWAAVLWLGPLGACCGGLSFHRPSGESAVPTRADESAYIAARFNRVVLFGSDAGAFCDRPAPGETASQGCLAQWVYLTPVGC
jgi:hypothetical protein